MNVRITLSLVAMLFSSGAVLARPQPIDLRPISAAAARQQLHELAGVLERYYPYLKTKSERARFNATARRLEVSVHGQIPTWREWLLQEELVRTLNDPHAELGMNALEDRALAVELHWVSNGLLISPAPWMHPALFPKNSEVIRIGHQTPAELLPRLEALYAGTPEWITVWPGFQLRYAFELRWLGLMHGNRPVRLLLRTPDGRLLRLELATTPLPDFRTLVKMAGHKPWFSWTVDKQHNIGWFTLNSMQVTGPYEKAADDFFAAVKRTGISRVVVDLRHNGGGWSLADAPFMQYLGVRQIQDYSSQTYFDPAHLKQEILHGEWEMRKMAPPGTATPNIPVPPQPTLDELFHGQFFVVTGPGSFSSAMEFAADVKFNHLGTVVGLPCGEVVTGPGDVKFFPHPASGVPFQVPTDVYTWPGLPQNAVVEPDVRIPLTVKDVQKGIDPVRLWFNANHADPGKTRRNTRPA